MDNEKKKGTGNPPERRTEPQKRRTEPEKRCPGPEREPEPGYSGAPKLRTWGFVVGAVVLLAVLTVVLCAMAGVFSFDGGGDKDAGETPAAQTQPPAVTDAPDATEPPPTETPEPEETPQPETHTINVIAGNGGSISPSGIVQVEDGGSITFTMTPDEGYELDELIIDGMSVILSDTYTLNNVRSEHTVYAIFRELEQPEETPPVYIPETTEEPYDPWYPYFPEESDEPSWDDQNWQDHYWDDPFYEGMGF